MLNDTFTRKVFTKQPEITFRDRKLYPYTKGYWIAQPLLIGIPYRYYYSRFQVNGWENVPTDKPVIFAINHRNAFMDSLAFVNTKSTQGWQLARGDAFNNKLLGNLFYFFHMLPLWRERDGVDTREMNQPTFNACADLLANNAMIGIYPEGNCINEEHIRPLKKGICRIAFLAEERYDFELDVHIIPVGINYTGAEKFKKWQLVNFGQPILLKKYSEQYKANPALAINQLKDEIERGMKTVSTHVEHGPLHHDIVELAAFHARESIITSGKPYEPITRFDAIKSITPILEHNNKNNHEAFKNIVADYHAYKTQRDTLGFRENTFDKARQSNLSMIFMTLYFIFLLPVFLFGLIINYIPYRIPQLYAEKKLKQQIFWSSAKYVLGFLVFPIYYLILMLIVWSMLGSLLSALIFLVAFPISGNIAFYYWYDFKKWWSVIRFKRMSEENKAQLTFQREKLFNTLSNLQ